METANLKIPASFDRLLLAFANLESYGIETRTIRGTDPRTELICLRASIREAFPAGTASCVFILVGDLGCFDSEGNLQRPIPLHHSGTDVTSALAAALADVGLAVLAHRGPNTVEVTDLEPSGNQRGAGPDPLQLTSPTSRQR